MTARYFLDTPVVGDAARLDGPEAHHLIHVMRAKPGMEIILFDGTGFEYRAEIESLGRTAVSLTILSRENVDREPPVHVTLGTPLPKGDRQKWLIEKAVELGVARIVPLETARSVAVPTPKALARLSRAVIEASKQSGRNRLTEIAAPQTWSDFVDRSRSVPCRLLAHPIRAASTGKPAPGDWSPSSLPAEVYLAVGPEGGLTDEEVALATEAHWQPVDLGPRILLVETAAFLLASLVVQPRLPWKPG
jgi:16S rRNA (uracil1498-N3)-methyltransferase